MPAQVHKRALIPLLAGVLATGPFAVDAYLPAMTVIAGVYDVDLQLMESSISTYLLGLAAGFLLGAPVSDRLGRRPTIAIGLTAYAISSALIAVSPGASAFLALRVVQAIGGGFAVVNSNAIVRDLYDERESAQAFTTLGLVVIIAPLIAPAVGSLLLQAFGWQSIFFAQSLFALTLIALVAGRLPETGAARNRLAERPGVFREIAQNLRRVFGNVCAMSVALALSMSFACMFVFISDASFAYMDYFGVSPNAFAALFAANMVTLVVFNRVNRRLLRSLRPVAILRVGVLLQLAASTALCVYVLATEPALPAVVALVMLAVGSLGMIGPNALATYMAQFSSGSGTASGVIGSAQFATGSLAGVVAAALSDGTLLSMGATMCACCLVASLALFAPGAVRVRG